jgi:hypothetical protein
MGRARVEPGDGVAAAATAAMIYARPLYESRHLVSYMCVCVSAAARMCMVRGSSHLGRVERRAVSGDRHRLHCRLDLFSTSLRV